MEAKGTQGRKEQKKHVQQVTQQNAIIQEQQKKIEELMTTSKSLITKMIGTLQTHENNSYKIGGTMSRQRKKRCCATTATAGYTITVTSVTHWKRTNSIANHGTTPILIQTGKQSKMGDRVQPAQ